MPADRWLAAAAAMFFFSSVPAGAMSPDPAPLPDGFTWVDRAPGDASATLHRVDSAGRVHDLRLDYAVNALGCASGGTLYGLAAARHGTHLTGGPHLLRISAAGAVRDLGTVDPAGLRYPLAQGYAGTVAGGRLLVGVGGFLREIRLDTTRPAVARSQPLPALPYIGDWALEPTTGHLDALVGAGGHADLLRLAPRTLAPTRTALPALPGGDGYGGIAWTGAAVLLAIRNDAHGPSAVYRIPLDNPSQARLLTRIGPAESSDATYCEPEVAAVASVPTTSPTPIVVRPPAPVLPAPPPPPPPVVSPTPKVTPKPSPSRSAAVVVPPPAPSPSLRPPRTAVRSRLVLRRPSLVSKRVIPMVGGAMVAVVLAIRSTRMTRTRR